MIAFTDPNGLRDYRVHIGAEAPARRRWVWLLLGAFLLGLLFGVELQAAAEDRCVRLQVRPTFLLRRGDVDVQARVARHPDHRALFVAWDSETGAGGSRTFALDGVTDPVLFQWWNVDQPPGAYVFAATVVDAGGQALGRDRAAIRSVEREP